MYSKCVNYDAIYDIDHVGYGCITYIIFIYVIVAASIVNLDISPYSLRDRDGDRTSIIACHCDNTWYRNTGLVDRNGS